MLNQLVNFSVHGLMESIRCYLIAVCFASSLAKVDTKGMKATCNSKITSPTPSSLHVAYRESYVCFGPSMLLGSSRSDV